jgi:hypothetical protein
MPSSTSNLSVNKQQVVATVVATITAKRKEDEATVVA